MSSMLHPDNDQTINPSGNESIRDVMEQFTGRRNFMKGSLATATLATLGGFSLESLAGGYPGYGYLVQGAPRTFVLSATVDF